MTATTVTSTALVAVAYDGDARCLWLEFRDHAVYRYDDVPQSAVEDLLATSSKGAYFHRHIRGRYAYRRVEGPLPLTTSEQAHR